MLHCSKSPNDFLNKITLNLHSMILSESNYEVKEFILRSQYMGSLVTTGDVD